MSALISGSMAYPSLTDKNYDVKIVASGLRFPTGMTFLGEDDILVLEKNQGTVKRIVNGNILNDTLLDVNVANKNERGMLGIATQENNGNNGRTQYVYLYFTESRRDDGDDFRDGQTPLANRLYRYELVGNHLVNPKVLLNLPANPGPGHNSGKIILGPDGNLYLTVGDLGKPTKSQNIVNGSAPDGRGGILRVTTDGNTVNGIIGDEYPLNLYYAYGIRNSFGISFDPVGDNLWDTENGDGFGDEINLVKPGFNSGWSRVQGIWKIDAANGLEVEQDPDNSLVNFEGKGEYFPPKFTWKNTIGVTALAFLNSTKFGHQYENDLFVGDFHKGNIYHFDLKEDRMNFDLKGNLTDMVADREKEADQQIFGKDFGGITDIKVGPDGYLYILSIPTTGGDCLWVVNGARQCTSYNSEILGTIYRIGPD